MRLLSRGPRRRTRPAGSTAPAASPARQALAHARELIHSLRWHRQLDARAWGLEAYDTLRQNTRAQRRRGRADPPGGGRGGGGGARARVYTPPYGWRGRTSGAIPAVCPSRCGTCAWPCATTMSSPAPPRQEEGQFRQDCPGRAGACVDAWVHAWYVQAGGGEGGRTWEMLPAVRCMVSSTTPCTSSTTSVTSNRFFRLRTCTRADAQ